MDRPFISIITINLNNATGLERTLKSIAAQKWLDKELIVIDGGSSDNSKAVIQRFTSMINYWVSEKDKGIYNAQNKGLMKCKGRYVNFMNSGDTYYDEMSLFNLAKVAKCGYDIIYGNVFFIEPGVREWIKEYPSKPDLSFWRYDTPAHNASLIKTSKLKSLGGYDENLLICSDWKFFLQAKLKYKLRFMHINKTVSVFYLDGVSARGSSQRLINEERALVWSETYTAPTSINRKFSSIQKRLKMLLYKIGFH